MLYIIHGKFNSFGFKIGKVGGFLSLGEAGLIGSNTCPPTHKLGIVVVSSKEEVRRLWKLMCIMPQCPCKEMVGQKGISVGWKLGNL
jgi:hypothetical protein